MSERFPDAELFFMEQRTPEWFEVRKGLITASELGPWILKADKTSKKARENAICKLLAEIAGCEAAPNFENWAMARGTELEPDAVAWFEAKNDLSVEEIGFCKSKLGSFGASPDGMVSGHDSSNIGFEGKCPVPPTHLKYLRNPDLLLADYHWQVQHSMATTGAEAWYLQSFCPALPSVQHFVERSDETETIRRALLEFSQELAQAQEEIASLWAAQFENASDK